MVRQLLKSQLAWFRGGSQCDLPSENYTTAWEVRMYGDGPEGGGHHRDR